MMVVDLMHEFELGVWKMLFTHLIRILYAASERPGVLVDELNTRYMQHGIIVNALTCQTGSVRFQRSVDLQSAAFTTMSRR